MGKTFWALPFFWWRLHPGDVHTFKSVSRNLLSWLIKEQTGCMPARVHEAWVCVYISLQLELFLNVLYTESWGRPPTRRQSVQTTMTPVGQQSVQTTMTPVGQQSVQTTMTPVGQQSVQTTMTPMRQQCLVYQSSKPGMGNVTANFSTLSFKSLILARTPSSSSTLALNSFSSGPQLAFTSFVSSIAETTRHAKSVHSPPSPAQSLK